MLQRIINVDKMVAKIRKTSVFEDIISNWITTKTVLGQIEVLSVPPKPLKQNPVAYR